MRRGLHTVLLALGLCMAAGRAGVGDSVVAPGASVAKLAGGFEFTEGPTCDAKGNLFFTDQPNDRILKWSAEGQLSTFLQPAGRANGLYFAPAREKRSPCSTRRAGGSSKSAYRTSAGRPTSASAAETGKRFSSTAGTGLYSVRTRVKGANAAK